MRLSLTSSFSLLLLTSLFLMTSSCPSNGATEDLREVLTGRCVQYKTTVNPSAVCGPLKEVNCTAVVNSFIEAFAGQQPCNVSMTRYDAFLSATRHNMPADQSLFWHSVYGWVHRYSQGGLRKITLEDTLTGYMIDGLRFCSDPSREGGIGGPETSFCPTFGHTDNCSLNAEVSFWSAASKDFATKARGIITVMLNASTGEGFSDTSFFGRLELPNLNASVVTHANIWLVQQPGDVIKERCDSETIQKLQTRFREKSISSTCIFNPQDVMWILCWDHQDDPQCRDLVASGGQSSVVMTTPLRLLFIVLLIVMRLV
ncbi:ADP-ribosyl cyclase/cyclic ADP-ribose hydrolase-like isoform X2 [Littorina saxatilis]